MDEGSPDSIWVQLRKLFGRQNGPPPLADIIREAAVEGEVESQDVELLLNVLELSRTSIREIMVPRPDVIFAELEDDVQTVAESIIKSGHSRIPIYKEDKDNVVGVVHAKDLLKWFLVPESAVKKVEAIMRKPVFVPEHKNVREALFDFLTKRNQIAFALDEYGGISGLVTLEDMLEEIVGEIEDEYDTHMPDPIQPLEDGGHLVSGRLLLDELGDQVGVCLDSEQVETIGGYLCELTGRVPQKGEFFTLDGRRFTIADADKKRVRWVEIAPGAAEEAD